MEKISCIYEILNLSNGKKYIGSAESFNRRKTLHLSNLRRGTHHSGHLQAAFNKYGETSFTFNVIEIVEDREILLAREQFYLDLFRSYECGYNIAKTAGSLLGYRFPEDKKRKGSDNPFYGKTHTDEVKKNMTGERNQFYGRKHSSETIDVIRQKLTGDKNPFYGRSHSQETKDKLSQKAKERHLKKRLASDI